MISASANTSKTVYDDHIHVSIAPFPFFCFLLACLHEEDLPGLLRGNGLDYEVKNAKYG